MGQSLDYCLDCKYCRLLDGSTNDLNIMTCPTDVNPILKNIPVVVNIFYGDPLLQIDKTVEILERLEIAKHKGPVIIITKGNFSRFPDDFFDLDLHFAFSAFGINHHLDGGTTERFLCNLAEAKCRGRYKYSIEFRPIIYGINDNVEAIDEVMDAAVYFDMPVGFSGLQGKPEVVECWKDAGLNLQPYPGTEFGYKKYVSPEVEKIIRSYGVPVFKKTSCLISYVHDMKRDYNAHYYRPNELDCKNCIMYGTCHFYYQLLPEIATPLPKLPFEFKILKEEGRTCPWYHKGCSFPSNDCTNLSGWFIKTDVFMTTSDVRMVKWLTGMTVIADFVESPYLSDFWLKE
jgi:hypothetical protein